MGPALFCYGDRIELRNIIDDVGARHSVRRRGPKGADASNSGNFEELTTVHRGAL
jgi:hypothetical protein